MSMLSGFSSKNMHVLDRFGLVNDLFAVHFTYLVYFKGNGS